jgi:hypothetical protein
LEAKRVITLEAPTGIWLDTKGHLMEFRAATQADIDYVRRNPHELAIKGYPDVEIPKTNVFTAIEDGEILGIFGLQIRWAGLGMFWLICRKEFLKLGTRTIITTIRKTIKIMIEDNKLYRAEAYIRTDFPEGARLVEFLGFNKEGIMKSFFPDKSDAYLYGKVI